MKRFSFHAVLAFGFSLASLVSAADFSSAQFNQATEPLKNYSYGDKGIDLVKIEAWVGEVGRDPQARTVVEQRLLELLAAARTRDARQFLLRQLYSIGTARSVAALEALLVDADVAHLARNALGRMEAPEAGEALRRALTKTSDDLQIGIINTLGQRREEKARPDLLPLLRSANMPVAVAAARALGKMADAATATALEKARDLAAPVLRQEINDALLRVAERWLNAGQYDEAARIYGSFYPNGETLVLKVAGLRGLALARKTEAGALLLRAGQSGEPAVRPHAIALLAGIPGPDATATLMNMARAGSADNQERVIRALGERGDSSAVPVIVDNLSHKESRVRIAAYEALGEMGGAAAIPALAKAAATTTGPEQQTARASLVRLGGRGSDDAFRSAASNLEPASRAEVIRAIGQRGMSSAMTELVAAARQAKETRVRQEACAALGRVSDPKSLPLLLELLMRPQQPDDRADIADAITQVMSRGNDRRGQGQLLVGALSTAPVEAKPALLGLLNQPATPEALQAVRAALQDSQPAVCEAASRTLGEWPSPEPAEDLLQIAKAATTSTARLLALRGYVRLTGMVEDPTANYVKAMALAQNDEERKLVLGGLSNAGSLTALELAEKYRSTPALEAEANLAAVRVAAQYCWVDPQRAKSTLENLAAQAPQEFVQKEAKAALQRIKDMHGYVVAWKVAGPYQVEGVNDGNTVFGTIFAPEKDLDDPAVHWRPLRASFEGGTRINLEATLGAVDYCSAYVRSTIWSTSAQEVKLSWAVDDYIKGWLNGKPIQEGSIPLKEGANSILLKVGDHGGGWNFSCRLEKPNGQPVEGVRFEAK